MKRWLVHIVDVTTKSEAEVNATERIDERAEEDV